MITRTSATSNTVIDYLYVSKSLLPDSKFEVISNILSDHNALRFQTKLSKSGSSLNWKHHYQLHPAFVFGVDYVNQLYALTSKALVSQEISVEGWYAMKHEISLCLSSWNKKYVQQSRSELLFLTDLAANPGEMAKLSTVNRLECKARLQMLQDEDLKLQRTIFVRNLRIKKQELPVLLKTSIFRQLKSSNLINTLKIGNIILTGLELADQIQSHLKNIFKSIHGYAELSSLDDSTVVSQDDLDRFVECNFSFMVIAENLKIMNKFAPAGPDSIPFLLYRRFHYLFIPLLILVFKNWLSGMPKDKIKTGSYFVGFDKRSREAMSSSAHQESHPSVKDLRPINIQDFDSKVFARILNNRLIAAIGDKIHPNQFCFRGRTIAIAVCLIREAHLVAKANKSGQLLALFDMQSAFDRVDHNFLMSQLRCLTNDRILVNGINNYIRGKWGTFKFHGLVSTMFPLEAGISQGSPLSSVCFAIYINSLLYDLDRTISGVFLPMLQSKLALVSYADDLAVIVQDETELLNVMKIIEDFGKVSGLTLNRDKSAVYRLRDFRPISILPVMAKKKFLGLPFPFFGCKARFEVQSSLFKKIKHILDTLKYSHLSLITKVDIVNKLCIPKLQYIGKFFSFSNKFIRSLDTLFSKFLWNSRIVLISRNILYGSKDAGGLGLIKTGLFLKLLRANILFGWLSFLDKSNIVYPFDPQDTPPPGLKQTDFFSIWQERTDILDDFPSGIAVGKLSTRLVRSLLIDPTLSVAWPPGAGFMKLVYKFQLPSNITSFCYKLSHKKLAVRDILVGRYSLNISRFCAFCPDAIEDLDHILLNCRYFKPIFIWLQDITKRDITVFQALFDFIEFILRDNKLLRVFILVWHICWRMRCLKVFSDMELRPLLFAKQELLKHYNADKLCCDGVRLSEFWPSSLVQEL